MGSQHGLAEALLMSTHNIYFPGEIRKILCEYPLLPGATLTLSPALVGPSEVCPIGDQVAGSVPTRSGKIVSSS